jgi:hypothetical protein
MDRLGLSARADKPILKVSRTIADFTDTGAIHAEGVQLVDSRQQAFDEIDGHVVRTLEPEFSSFGFADGRRLTGNDVCFLNKDFFKFRKDYLCNFLYQKVRELGGNKEGRSEKRKRIFMVSSKIIYLSTRNLPG